MPMRTRLISRSRELDENGNRLSVATIQIIDDSRISLSLVVDFLNRPDCLEIINAVMEHGVNDVHVELENASQLRTGTSVTRFKFKDKKPSATHPVETIDSLEI